jgi:CBS domain-containing protein
VVLGGLFWGASHVLRSIGVAELWTAVFRYLGFINVALAVFNLLPGFPLDGGRLLRAVLWKRTGDLQAATHRAADWGGGIAVGLMALGALQIFAGALVGGLWLIFIGMFLRGAARASYYGVVVQHALGQTRVRDIMVRDPVMVSPNTTVEDAIEEYFLRYGYGGFPVGTDGKIEGLLSLPMVQRCPRDERSRRKARDIMSSLDEQAVIAGDAKVSEALQAMTAADVGRLLVVERGRFEGMITRSGIIRFIQLKTQLEAGE